MDCKDLSDTYGFVIGVVMLLGIFGLLYTLIRRL